MKLRKLNTACVGAAILCLLSACTKPEDEAAQTVDYYRAHTAERQALVKACANDPARARQRPACINAMAAEAREGIGSVSELPPMGLLPEGKKTGDAR
jgi:hypothetical protein